VNNSIPLYVFSSLFYSTKRGNQTNLPFYHLYINTDNRYLKKLLVFIFLDLNIQSKNFSDLVAIDYPTKINRFHLLYNILSITYNIRIFLSIWNNELDKVNSIVDIFPAASWYEREMWDLFGIHFEGNSDLRRILTDYGFFGHPFRKDFPLSGFTELYHNSRLDSIVHQPISLIQEYRQFETLSPWDWFNKE
jgi:NADH-quinone oxidoreductase subunit C